MGLFTPIWMTDNKKKLEKAILAIQKIDDQIQLKAIALQAPLTDVKRAAVNQIYDQETLLELAYKTGNSFARKKLDLSHRKQYIMTSDNTDQVTRALLDGFEDAQFLEDFVLTKVTELPSTQIFKDNTLRKDDLYELLMAVLLNIHDQEFLYKLVIGDIKGPLKVDEHSYALQKSGIYYGWTIPLCEVAIWNITDENKLFKIAHVPWMEMWKAAISRMHDKELLQRLIEEYDVYYNTTGWAAKEQIKGAIFYTPPHSYLLKNKENPYY